MDALGMIGESLGFERAPEDVDQRWFWTPTWQEREQEADADITAGNVQFHNDADAFMAHLDCLASDAE
jgi:hypothetical protein